MGDWGKLAVIWSVLGGRAENICPHQMPLPLYDQWDHERTQHLHGMLYFWLNVTCLKNNEARSFLVI